MARNPNEISSIAVTANKLRIFGSGRRFQKEARVIMRKKTNEGSSRPRLANPDRALPSAPFGTHDVMLSAAVCVSNPDRSPCGIHG
jgi:hypothetical protein